MKLYDVKFKKNTLIGILAILFTLTTAQAVELVEIKPINHANILATAKLNLAAQLQTMPTKLNLTKQTSQELLSKQAELLALKTNVHKKHINLAAE